MFMNRKTPHCQDVTSCFKSLADTDKTSLKITVKGKTPKMARC